MELSLLDTRIIELLKSKNGQSLSKGAAKIKEEYWTSAFSFLRQRYSDLDDNSIESYLYESITDLSLNVIAGKYNGKSSIKTYLISIANNKCLKAIQKRLLITADNTILSRQIVVIVCELLSEQLKSQEMGQSQIINSKQTLLKEKINTYVKRICEKTCEFIKKEVQEESIALVASGRLIQFIQTKLDINWGESIADIKSQELISKIEKGLFERLKKDIAKIEGITFEFFEPISYVKESSTPSTEIQEEEDPRIGLIRKKLLTLDPLCRTILQMRFTDGLKLQEIAEEMDRKYTSIKKMAWRCTKKLRDMIVDAERHINESSSELRPIIIVHDHVENREEIWPKISINRIRNKTHPHFNFHFQFLMG